MWAFAGFLIISVIIFTVSKPYLGDSPDLSLQLSLRVGLNMLMSTNETFGPQKSYFKVKEVKLSCNSTHPRSEVCDIKGDVRIQGKSSNIVIASTEVFEDKDNDSWSIKPYARKESRAAMEQVSSISIKKAQNKEGLPDCSRNYSIPAIVFSTGGFSGNYFHDFTDLLIPLYSTSIQFNGQVIFLITDKHSIWINKYKQVLQKLSRYDQLIDFDKENEVLCFPRIVVGLKGSIKELAIDSSQSSYSIKGFREFLRNTYSLKREFVNITQGKRPRLLIISRSKTRKLLNAGELAGMAESLGFDAAIKETVMIIQIIPFGLGPMEWISRTDFEVPAKEMNLRYLGCRISPNESSLVHQYPYIHEVFKAPGAISKKGWNHFSSIYLEKQDVQVDLSRFRKVLLNTLELLQS
ncbi:hypothetical protein ACH5RR_024924 [Cinchona calisaya]|uniref:Glycosyltransferase n=1 Tax=Cinchona calisaya TaxID=153742 RepID=A0ABD2Z297_9GENT